MKVIVKDFDLNQALKKFKKKARDLNIVAEVVARDCYESPSEKKQRKAKAARARWQKRLRCENLPRKHY